MSAPGSPAAEVVVVGGCGLVGSHLVRQLLGDGVAVVVADVGEQPIPTYVAQAASERGLSYLSCDITRTSDIERLFDRAGPFDVVNCAALLPGAPRGPMFDVNTEALWRLCEVASASRMHRLIQLSSRSVYGRYHASEGPLDEAALPRPAELYGATKAAADIGVSIYREAFGLDAVALRITGVYGPLPSGSFDRSNTTNPVTKMAAAGHGSTTYRAPVGPNYRYEVTYVKDVVRGVLAVREASALDAAIYNLASADGAPTLSEIAQQVSEVFPTLLTEYPSHDAGSAMEPRAAMSMTRLEGATGYKPAWPLSRALPDYVGWMRDGAYGENAR